MPRKRLYLIDGNSFCYRAYYAIRPLFNSKGQPTNAVYGFITMLHKTIKENSPDMLAVAFDMKGPTFRHEKFEEYKIHRKPMPDELVSQIPLIKKVVEGHNIPIYELQGYEADDILATLAVRAEKDDIDTYIITGDKDALQLVGSHIRILNTHKDNLLYDREMVKNIYGVDPELITDIMALMGDPTDNIPGVPGIGEKTAVELIKQFGSLDNLLSNVDKLKSESRRKLIKENASLATLSKELAVLDKDVPVKIDFDEMRLKEPDNVALLKLYKELEFKSLIKDLTPKEALDSSYCMVNDEKALTALVEKLKGQNEFVLDTETTSEDPMLACLVGISFSWKVGEAFYVPFNAALKGDDILRSFKPVLENGKISKIGQNIKYDYIVLANHGIRLNGISFDTMVASYVLNPSKLNHNLEDISIEYLNHKMTTSIEELIGKGMSQITMDKVDIAKACDYCCEDSDVTLRVKMILEKDISKKGLEELFYKVEMPLVEVLASMEMSGIAIDEGYLRKLSTEMDERLGSLTKKIYKLAGEEFNIKSPKQLSKILFEKLKLPVLKKTKTGVSTNEDVLIRLSQSHDLPKIILDYRELAKLKSTYVDALPAMVNPKTGRVHTSFNQTVTATGRLSSSEPNLQNIPIRTEEGRKIRKAIVASTKQSVLLSADYSQIELRVLAHLSQDKNLVKAFKEGRDVHAYTAALVFGVDEKDVSAQMRSMAKTVNFGIIYGMSPYGLSQNLKIDVDKAKNFIDAYFERYPDVRQYLEGLIEEARSQGYVTTILGRRRYIPEIDSQDMRLRQFAERTAVNTPIQGSAADIIKVAMIDVNAKLVKSGLRAKMILQVHDELVLDVPKNELAKAAGILKEGMEEVIKLNVPVEAHIEVGNNWLELNDYEDKK